MKAAEGWRMCSGELLETARERTKRAADERNGGKARQRSHKAPLGEKRRTFSEERALYHLSGLGSARGQAEKRGQGFWDAEELDPDQALGWCPGITRQALCPREAVMRPLRTGQQGRTCGWLSLLRWSQVDLHLLVSEQLPASSAMGAPAPVSPEQGGGPNRERMEEHTHPTWLLRVAAVPLALLSQGTVSTLADASRIHEPQAAVSF